jgi:predicted acetyltransferase
VTIDISKLETSHRDVFLKMLDDYDAHDPENGEFYRAGRADFTGYVRRLHDWERGINLPQGWVPCSNRWLIDETRAICGVVRVRHNIDTPFLSQEAGHIGYDVPPSKRGRGYGAACLRAGLVEARRLGLARVLLCAGAGNPASWRTIEACGGVLECEVHSEFFGYPVRRYWIEVPRAEEAK